MYFALLFIGINSFDSSPLISACTLYSQREMVISLLRRSAHMLQVRCIITVISEAFVKYGAICGSLKSDCHISTLRYKSSKGFYTFIGKRFEIEHLPSLEDNVRRMRSCVYRERFRLCGKAKEGPKSQGLKIGTWTRVRRGVDRHDCG